MAHLGIATWTTFGLWCSTWTYFKRTSHSKTLQCGKVPCVSTLKAVVVATYSYGILRIRTLPRLLPNSVGK